jgi:toxin ParE1/3/4
MSYVLIIRPEAEDDLTEARDWYNGRRDGLGAEFLTAVEESLDRVRESPLLRPPEYRSVRRFHIARFPYIVYYRILGETIEVIAVQHGGRNPRGWRGRT